MTVAALSPSASYLENGVTLAFAAPFRFLNPTHLEVKRIAADGTVTVLTYGVDYTVTGGSTDAGGTVTLIASTSGATLKIRRVTPRAQQTDYVTNDTFPAESHEAALDRQMLIDQEQDVKIDDTAKRALMWPEGEQAAPLPSKASFAGKYFVGDPSGNPVPASGTGADSALRADLAALDGAGLVGLKQPGTGAVVDTVLAAIRREVWVKQFGAVGDGVTNDAASIQAAINYVASVGGGRVLFDAGNYKVNSTLTIPGLVTLIGKGGGRVAQPTIAAATRILWGGGAAEVVKMGWQAGLVAGGGIENIRIDGSALATRCLAIKDHQHGTYRGLVLTGASSDGLYFTNTDGRDPTGLSLFEDLQISLRGGATNAANGIQFDGVGSGVSGVTICTFIRPRIEHANGAGVYIGLRGDGMVWVQPQIFRADVETGIGVWAASTNPAQVIGGYLFEAPIISSGIRIDQAGAAAGWNVTLADDVNVNSGFTRFVYGKGADDVAIHASYAGRLGGPAKTLGWRDSIVHDPMHAIYWDSANTLLHTTAGNWKTSPGGVGATIADATQPGGAVSLTTSNVINSECWIRYAQDFTSGISLGTHYPSVNCTIAPITLTNVLLRFGLMGDYNATPNNGAFVQFDPSVSANYVCTCVAAGSITSVVTSVAAATQKIQWRIEATEGAVNFFYRTGSNRLWGLAASIATNLPSASLALAYYLKTKANAFAAAHIYDTKFSHVTE